jgi:hypothetical protein
MHHWKILITTFAVLGIAALLFMRSVGNTGMGDVFSSFMVRLNPVPTGNAFPIELQTSLSKLQGNSYDVVNISMRAEGACTVTKLSSSMEFEQKGGVCRFSVDSASGKLSFSNGVAFDTDIISAKVQPGSILIGGMVANRMSLLDVTGSIRIFQNNTWVSVPLEGKNIEASGVIGNMKVDGDSVTLNALVVSVKGDGGSGPGFKWSG